MDRRRLLFTGLAGVLAAAFAVAPAAEALTLSAHPAPEPLRADTLPPEPLRAEPLQAEPAQYRPPPPRGRRRCWTEQRRVAFRDRYGRIRHRIVQRRVCR
ncbi:hypothetical protein C8P66_101381 [Humitalea rosea]|uniref:Uncharacterized protein n=1 Tax=Humitalea rosea TaxID=990373 RepID=A0A2W7IUM3_9PROT|nr:hypothetical protein [Humitalea rosea]PZW51159.1 hypothetical protein C8P66_101381 [Humitalea rosea]